METPWPAIKAGFYSGKENRRRHTTDRHKSAGYRLFFIGGRCSFGVSSGFLMRGIILILSVDQCRDPEIDLREHTDQEDDDISPEQEGHCLFRNSTERLT